MFQTQYLVAASIDGFIADAGNSLEWLFDAHTQAAPDAAAANALRFTKFFAGVGAMAMGATTYEWVLGHEHLLDQPGRWQDYYGDVPCWIFTHRDLPAIPGARLHFVSGAVAPVHDQMTTAADGRNVWLVGGGELVGQFADHGLLNEIILAVAPVLLGSGAPLLPRRLTATQLALTDCSHDGTFAYLSYSLQPQPVTERTLDRPSAT
jgi:dihydrofolate reductase